MDASLYTQIYGIAFKAKVDDFLMQELPNF
jgi:hypothetical protein